MDLEMKSISANDLSAILNAGKTIELIDVRTPAEYRAMHVTIARNEPLDRLDPKAIQAAGLGQPLNMGGRSGARTRQA